MKKTKLFVAAVLFYWAAGTSYTYGQDLNYYKGGYDGLLRVIYSRIPDLVHPYYQAKSSDLFFIRFAVRADCDTVSDIAPINDVPKPVLAAIVQTIPFSDGHWTKKHPDLHFVLPICFISADDHAQYHRPAFTLYPGQWPLMQECILLRPMEILISKVVR